MVPAKPRRRGNRGYGRLGTLKALVYSRLKALENGTRIVKRLERHRRTVGALGLLMVIDGAIIGRRWRRCSSLVEEVFEGFSSPLRPIAPTGRLIASSKLLEDLYDSEAEWSKK